MARAPSPDFISRQTLDSEYLFLNLAPRAGSGLAVACAGRERCAPNYCVDRLDFPFSALEVVAAGSAMLTLEGRRFRIGPGAVFAYLPGMSHRIASDVQGYLVKYFVDLSGSGARKLLRDTGLTQQPRQLRNLRWTIDLFDQLLACRQYEQPTAEDLALSIVRLLLRRLGLDLKADTEPGPATGLVTFERCQRYIEEHFRTVRRVEQVARACGVSTEYLCKLFRRYSHRTAHQTIVQLKMDYAAGLLVRDECTVAAAAKAVGYDDPFHFSRAFRRVFGLPPRSVKRSVRRAEQD